MPHRNPWLDYTKAIACLLIVCHHLAFYGPMTDVLRPVLPALMEWLFDYARMAVQVFLVIAGYLAAAALAPEGFARTAPLMSRLGKRFARLVLPFVVALAVTIVITEVVRDWGFAHGSMSASPSLPQVLAHLFLLHGMGGWESLSAGVWYVAIDFQLYALAAVWVWLCGRMGSAPGGGRWQAVLLPAGVVALCAASLWGWNLDSGWDNWALYFFGAYGLGMMGWWAAHSANARARWGWVALMVLLGAVALALQWRPRIALALVAAVLLGTSGALPWPPAVRQWYCAPLLRLGQMSYSVFLIHFSVSLLVNAVVTLYWPQQLAANALGVVAAVLLSVAAGYVLYEGIEKRSASWRKVLGWQAGTLGVGAAAALQWL